MAEDPAPEPQRPPRAGSGNWIVVAAAWTLVGVPLAWGIYKALEKALVLFR